jgi:hypothetical protein
LQEKWHPVFRPKMRQRKTTSDAGAVFVFAETKPALAKAGLPRTGPRLEIAELKMPEGKAKIDGQWGDAMAKAKNRFEQVDEVQPDAITLALAKKDGDTEAGVVIFPASASAGRLVQDSISGELSPQDAFRSVIKLANEMKVAVVVMDPHGIWKPEWGDLYRDTEAGG